RYGSAGALADDLDRWLRGEPVHARRSSPWERTLKWGRRRPAAAALVAVSTLAIATLAISSVAYNVQLQDRLNRAEGLRLPATSRAVLPSNPGQGLLLAVEGARRYRTLLANNALYAALDACREQHTLLGHGECVEGVIFSPDGGHILSWSRDRTARLWDVTS